MILRAFSGIYNIPEACIPVTQVGPSFKYRLQICEVKCPAFTAFNVEILLFCFVIHRHLLHQFADRFSFFLFDGNSNNTSAGKTKPVTIISLHCLPTIRSTILLNWP